MERCAKFPIPSRGWWEGGKSGAGEADGATSSVSSFFGGCVTEAFNNFYNAWALCHIDWAIFCVYSKVSRSVFMELTVRKALQYCSFSVLQYVVWELGIYNAKTRHATGSAHEWGQLKRLLQAADWCLKLVHLLPFTAVPSHSITWIRRSGQRGSGQCGAEESAELDHWRVGGAEAGTSLDKGASLDYAAQASRGPGMALAWKFQSDGHEQGLQIVRCHPRHVFFNISHMGLLGAYSWLIRSIRLTGSRGVQWGIFIRSQNPHLGLSRCFSAAAPPRIQYASKWRDSGCWGCGSMVVLGAGDWVAMLRVHFELATTLTSRLIS